MLNARQEKFVSLYTSGQTATQAYSEAYGRAGHSAEASAGRLLRNAEVQARLAEIRAKAGEAAGLTLAEVLRALRAIYETPIAALDEKHPLTRRMVVREAKEAGRVVRSVRIVEKDSPLAALVEIGRLLGLGQTPAKPGLGAGQPQEPPRPDAEALGRLFERLRAKRPAEPAGRGL